MAVSVLVVIPSVVRTSSKPLSYTPTRSVFTHEQRFAQLLESIASVRRAIPQATVVVAEGGTLTDSELSTLKNQVDVFLDLTDNPQVVQGVQSPYKNLGESRMLMEIFKRLSGMHLAPDASFIKLTGRYTITETCNVHQLLGSADAVVLPVESSHQMSTRLYKLPAVWIKDLGVYLSNLDETGLLTRESHETSMWNFVSLRPHVKVSHIGVRGLIAVDNCVIDE